VVVALNVTAGAMIVTVPPEPPLTVVVVKLVTVTDAVLVCDTVDVVVMALMFKTELQY
jgi:hypothetical protein